MEHENTTMLLLVDDDTLQRKAIARQLRAQVGGIHITEAGDFDSARAMLERFTFNIVLSDYNLKCGLTGFNVLDYTREFRKAARRVLMSAEAIIPPTTLKGWLDKGVLHSFWLKSDTIAELLRALELEPTGPDESSAVEDINDEAEAAAVEESEGGAQADPAPSVAVHKFSCKPMLAKIKSGVTLDKIEGRLKRAHIQEHLAFVVDAFIETYDWKGDLDWFVAGLKTRPPSDRERKWLRAELAKIHEHVHNRIGKNYD